MECRRFQSHQFLKNDICIECNRPESEHVLVDSDDVDSEEDEAQVDCTHFVAHFFIWDTCRDCGRNEESHETSSGQNLTLSPRGPNQPSPKSLNINEELTEGSSPNTRSRSRSPLAVKKWPKVLSPQEVRARGMSEPSEVVSETPRSQKSGDRLEVEAMRERGKSVREAIRNHGLTPPSKTATPSPRKNSLQRVRDRGSSVRDAKSIFERVVKYASDFATVYMGLDGLSEQNFEVSSRAGVLQALTHTLSQLDVVLEDIEVLRTVPTPDKQNDIRVKFKIKRKVATNIPNRSLKINKLIVNSIESGALEKEFAKKGVKCTPYIPKDPSFFSVIVRGASKPTLLKGHISDAFLESLSSVMTFTSVTPQDLSVASVEESYSDDKLGTFNLDDGDLSVSVSVKPGMSESGQDVKSIVKAIEDGSLVSSLKLHGLGEVSVYDPLDYKEIRLGADIEAGKFSFVLLGASAGQLADSSLQEAMKKAIGSILSNLEVQVSCIDVNPPDMKLFSTSVMVPKTSFGKVKSQLHQPLYPGSGDVGYYFSVRRGTSAFARLAGSSLGKTLEKALKEALASGSLTSEMQKLGLKGWQAMDPDAYAQKIKDLKQEALREKEDARLAQHEQEQSQASAKERAERKDRPLASYALIVRGATEAELASSVLQGAIVDSISEVVHSLGFGKSDISVLQSCTGKPDQMLLRKGRLSATPLQMTGKLGKGDYGLQLLFLNGNEGWPHVASIVSDIEAALAKGIGEDILGSKLKAKTGKKLQFFSPETYSPLRDPSLGIIMHGLPASVQVGRSVLSSNQDCSSKIQAALLETLQQRGVAVDEIRLTSFREGAVSTSLIQGPLTPVEEMENLIEGDMCVQFEVVSGATGAEELAALAREQLKHSISDGSLEAALKRHALSSVLVRDPEQYSSLLKSPPTSEFCVIASGFAAQHSSKDLFLSAVAKTLGIDQNLVSISEINTGTFPRRILLNGNWKYGDKPSVGPVGILGSSDKSIQFLVRLWEPTMSISKIISPKLIEEQIEEAIGSFAMDHSMAEEKLAVKVKNPKTYDPKASVDALMLARGAEFQSGDLVELAQCIGNICSHLGVLPSDVTFGQTVLVAGDELPSQHTEQKGKICVGKGDSAVETFVRCGSVANGILVQQAIESALHDGHITSMLRKNRPAAPEVLSTLNYASHLEDVERAEREKAERIAAEEARLTELQRQRDEAKAQREAEIARMQAEEEAHAHELRRVDAERKVEEARLQEVQQQRVQAKAQRETEIARMRAEEDAHAEELKRQREAKIARMRAEEDAHAEELRRHREAEVARIRAEEEAHAEELKLVEEQSSLHQQALEDARRQLLEESRELEEGNEARLREQALIDAREQLELESAELRRAEEERAATLDAMRLSEERVREMEAETQRRKRLQDMELATQKALRDAKDAAHSLELEAARLRALEEARVQLERNSPLVARKLQMPETGGSPPRITAAVNVPKLKIKVQCHDLLQMDWLTMVHPIVGLFEWDASSSSFVLIDQTEWKGDSQDPVFDKIFSLQHRKGTGQKLLLRVYDGDTRFITENCLQGQALVDVDKLVQRNPPGSEILFSLVNVDDILLNGQLEKEGTAIGLTFHEVMEPASSEQTQLQLELSCINLPREGLAEFGFANVAPVAAVFMKALDPFEQANSPVTLTYIGQTEKSVERANSQVQWKRNFYVDFSSEELDKEMQISVYDAGAQRVTEHCRVGSAVVKLANVAVPGAVFESPLHNEDFQSVLTHCKIVIRCVQILNLKASKLKDDRKAPRIQVKRVSGARDPRARIDVVSRLEEMMNYGRNFKRFFLGKKFQYIALFYRSPPLEKHRTLFWCGEGERRENHSRSMLLRHITAIVIGKQTQAFQQKKAKYCKDEHCLSIVSQNRGGAMNILNLEAKHETQRDSWVYGLTALLKRIGKFPRIFNAGEYNYASFEEADEEEFSYVNETSRSSAPTSRSITTNRNAAKRTTKGRFRSDISKSSIASPSKSRSQASRSSSKSSRGVRGSAQLFDCEVSVNCQSLPLISKGKGHYSVIAWEFHETDGKWKFLSQTDSIVDNELSPTFKVPCKLTYRPRSKQLVRFSLYHMDKKAKKSERNAMLGSALVRLSELTSNPEDSFSYQLFGESEESQKLLQGCNSSILLQCIKKQVHMDPAVRVALGGILKSLTDGNEFIMQTQNDQHSARRRLFYRRDNHGPGYIFWSDARERDAREVPEQCLSLSSIRYIDVGGRNNQPKFQAKSPPDLVISFRSKASAGICWDLVASDEQVRAAWEYGLLRLIRSHGFKCSHRDHTLQK